MLLYKFRSVAVQSFKYTQDIFVNRRLFLPAASALNDPNEGVGTVDINNQYRQWGNQIFERNRRSSVRLCAFSATYRSPVLWAHYADEHKGICIEIDTDELPVGEGLLRKIQYTDVPPTFPHSSSFDEREAFLNKTTEWAYEQEWRYISKERSTLELGTESIKRVLLGARFAKSDIDSIEFWLSNYSPNRQIPVVQMHFASTDYMLHEESEMRGKISRMS